MIKLIFYGEKEGSWEAYVWKGIIVKRENIFHHRCSVEEKNYSLIIDEGIVQMLQVLARLAEKLGLKTTHLSMPYKLQ